MQLYNGDCLEIMKNIADKSVDMILCDLPYGTTRNKWDSVIPLEALWEQYRRVIKPNGAIVLTAQTPFDKVLGCSNLQMLKYEWIWEKSKSTGYLNAKKMPMKAHENILVFYKRLPNYNPQYKNGRPYSYNHEPGDSGSNYGTVGYSTVDIVTTRYPRSVIRFDVDRKAEYHPTQKPVALFEYLIKTNTNPGELVLDNCMGSGSTGVACVNTNRKFIGIELDEKYYDISCKRITNAINEKEQSLF